MPNDYTPPKVWKWEQPSGGAFANINRPIAGATHEKDLPVGEHPLQLYSLATPNGVKVTILLEELLEAGHDAEYDAWLIDIGKGDQFGIRDCWLVRAHGHSLVARVKKTAEPGYGSISGTTILIPLNGDEYR